LHAPLLASEDVDNFVILRARAFTSKTRRKLTREVLQAENLPILEWQLLFSIARFGSCHVAYVTQRTSIDPAHGSRAASALEKKGLITRREDPANKRRKLISLTSKGVETFERIWPKARQVTSSLTDRLNPEEFLEFKRLLDILNATPEPHVQSNEDR
jgi:DNA-binding MarR family transcriptional regulator